MKVLLVQLPNYLQSHGLQASLSMGFCRQEYWSVLPFLSPGDLSDPWIEPGSPILQAYTLLSEPPGKSRFVGNLIKQIISAL